MPELSGLYLSELWIWKRMRGMQDQYKRTIDYMRISVTDRCNLRCKYCMPEGVASTSHEEILRYEEILKICKEAVQLGIVNFKVTGGEPLVRKGVLDFMEKLKRLEGVSSVTLTTNGVALREYIPRLKAMGIDGINISLDTIKEETYEKITGKRELSKVLEGISRSCEAGIRTKINCVLLDEYRESIGELASFAERENINVRFIELMPIGIGKGMRGISQEEARVILLEKYPDLSPVKKEESGRKVWGNGPARYETSGCLKGTIGWIDAVSHAFCESCNRVRLTSTGMLKPCLCYGESRDLRKILRENASEEKLREEMRETIYYKPRAHCFGHIEEISESKKMVEIGG